MMSCRWAANEAVRKFQIIVSPIFRDLVPPGPCSPNVDHGPKRDAELCRKNGCAFELIRKQ